MSPYLIATCLCAVLWVIHLIWLFLDMGRWMHTWVDHGGDLLAALGFLSMYLRDRNFIFFPVVIGYFIMFFGRLYIVQCLICRRPSWFWKPNNKP